MERQTFKGGVFSDAVPDGRAGATVTLQADGLTAETGAGQRLSIAWQDCSLEQGGASGKMIFCRTPDRALTIYSESAGFLDALSATGKLEPQLQSLRAQVGIARQRSRRWFFGIVATAALLGAGGYFGMRRLASSAVKNLPVSVDRKIGDLAYASMDVKGVHVTDPVVVGAMTAIVDRLKPTSANKEMEFRVAVVDAPIVNAFCLPGGRIVIYTGLIRKAANPSQVAAVLAHEIAHATLRHGLQRIVQSVGVVLGIQIMLGDVGGIMAVAAEMGQAGLLTSYGRDQETAADMEGVRMAHAAGIDGQELAHFFAILQQESGDLPSELAWLSSHPQLSERQSAIAARVAQLGPLTPRPWPMDWKNVVSRAGNPEAKQESVRPKHDANRDSK